MKLIKHNKVLNCFAFLGGLEASRHHDSRCLPFVLARCGRSDRKGNSPFSRATARINRMSLVQEVVPRRFRFVLARCGRSDRKGNSPFSRATARINRMSQRARASGGKASSEGAKHQQIANRRFVGALVVFFMRLLTSLCLCVIILLEENGWMFTFEKVYFDIKNS